MRRLVMPQSAHSTQARGPVGGSPAVQTEQRFGPAFRNRININYGANTDGVVTDGSIPGV